MKIAKKTLEMLALSFWGAGLSITAVACALALAEAWTPSNPLASAGLGVGIGWLAGAVAVMGPLFYQEVQKRRFAADQAAVSPVIGVILMVAITVVLAAVVFVFVSDLGDVSEQAPHLTFKSEDDGYLLLQAPKGHDWEDFDVTGCLVVPEGPLAAGDLLDECTDPVRVVHVPTNSVVWTS